MTQDDKVFFTGLFKGLEGRFDGLERRFDRLEQRFDGLEQRFDGLEQRFDGLEQRFGGLENRVGKLEIAVEQNSRDIRYNGIQIELMRDDISLIGERDSYYDQLRTKVDAMYDIVTIDVPAIKHAVIGHERRIKALEAKRV